MGNKPWLLQNHNTGDGKANTLVDEKLINGKAEHHHISTETEMELTKFSLLASADVVILTISGAASDQKFCPYW